jgi:hypothetical protein
MRVNGFLCGSAAAALPAVLLALLPAAAAEITSSPPFVFVEGTIDAGDDLKFEQRVAGNNGPSIVKLESDGGDLRAAMGIGRLVRKNGWAVSVDDYKRCASSCVFILAAGATKIVGRGAEVVIHRPFFASGDPGEDYAQEFKMLQKDIRSYFAEMNVPESLVDYMFSIPPHRQVTLSRDELALYMLKGDDPVYEQQTITREANKLGISEVEYLSRKSASEQVCAFSYVDDSFAELAIGAYCGDAIMKGVNPATVGNRLTYALRKRTVLKGWSDGAVEACIEDVMTTGATLANCRRTKLLSDEELFGAHPADQ